jgi:GT2 family glycosyltransferase/SAM-dependent methyltransferase
MTDGNIGKSELPRKAPSPAATPPASEYGPEYYDTYGRVSSRMYTRENPHWLKFFGHVADEIVRLLNPRTVLDVGCAKGFLVESLRDRGVEAYGFDVSEYAIGEVRHDIQPYCWVGSATNSINENYDLITCIEVCEHVSESDAREAVRQITSHTDTALFSSTPSDFAEPTHVNVRPIIDWVRLFAEFSFAPEQQFDGGFLAPQAMLFRRAAALPSDQALCRFANRITQAVVKAEDLPEILALRQELKAIHNSKPWKLLNLYRDLRFRVKHPIAQGIRRLRKGSTRHLSYEQWIRRVEQRSYDPGRIAQAIANFRYRPKISIIMPVYNTPLEILDLAIRSVLGQQYENWELCICDDGSPGPELKARLGNWRERDPRIKITYSAKNEGISAASNRALNLATGEFVGLLDHDDELSPDALFEVVNLLQGRPDGDIVYSDEDKLDPQGRRFCPHFKADWSPEQFLSGMYFCHFSVYRRRLVEEVGGFRLGFEGAQDYDLALRVVEKTDRIYHIPKVLYHWRMAATSFASSSDAKPYAHEAGKRALNEHVSRRQIPGEIISGKWPAYYRLRFKLEGTDKVSIIIPTLASTDTLKACIRSIEEKTSYRNYEIIVVENGGLDPGTKQYLLSKPHGVIFADKCFSVSKLINRGAARAAGTYLLLLHDDVEVISSDWMTSMLGFCRLPGIGAVGAKLLYRTGQLQDIGIVLGLKGLAGHPLRGLDAYPRGYLDPSEIIRNCSAVSGACMMVRRELFEKLGGFDEQLPNAYNDVDFCLKLREAGYRIVWTPDARLYHDEPAGPQANGREAKYFRDRWRNVLKNDPYYNPNLTLRHEDLGYRI